MISMGRMFSADRTLEFEGSAELYRRERRKGECDSELTMDHVGRQRTPPILVVVAKILFPMIIAP